MKKPTARDRSDSRKGKGKGGAKGKGKSGGLAMAASEGNEQAQANGGKDAKFGGLKKLWCPFYLKGKCTRGSECPLPHVSGEAKTALQAAIATNKKSGAR